MRKSLLPILVPMLVAIPAVAAAEPAYQVIATHTEVIGPLVRTVETVQAGPNPIDRFEVYRVRHT
ncbi:MAG: hypothetical protein ACK4N5_14845, partial [Myxococcales bacterium]